MPLGPVVTTLMIPSSIDAKQISRWLTRNNRPLAFSNILDCCGFCDSNIRTSVSNLSEDELAGSIMLRARSTDCATLAVEGLQQIIHRIHFKARTAY
jgi:hypothetical protein